MCLQGNCYSTKNKVPTIIMGGKGITPVVFLQHSQLLLRCTHGHNSKRKGHHNSFVTDN